jgi:hypothetical protein
MTYEERITELEDKMKQIDIGHCDECEEMYLELETELDALKEGHDLALSELRDEIEKNVEEFGEFPNSHTTRYFKGLRLEKVLELLKEKK